MTTSAPTHPSLCATSPTEPAQTLEVFLRQIRGHFGHIAGAGGLLCGPRVSCERRPLSSAMRRLFDVRPAGQTSRRTTPRGGRERAARRPTTARVRSETLLGMSAAEIRVRLCDLQLERLEAESCGLAGNRAYMEDLESERADCQRALIAARSMRFSPCAASSRGASTAERSYSASGWGIITSEALASSSAAPMMVPASVRGRTSPVS
jgi:hypothetical protein